MTRPRRREFKRERDYLVAFIVWLDGKHGSDVAKRAAKWREHERKADRRARQA